MNQYGNVKQTAEAVGVGHKTVRRWVKEGLLPAELVPGAYGLEYRISFEEAEAVRDRKAESILQRTRKPVLETAEELARVRELLEAQAVEIRDLRGQLYQVEHRIISALPAPAAERPRRRWWWKKKPKTDQ